MNTHEHEIFSEKWTQRCEQIVRDVRAKRYTVSTAGLWHCYELSDGTIGLKTEMRKRPAISFKLESGNKLLVLASGRGKYRYCGYDVTYGQKIKSAVAIGEYKRGNYHP